MTVFYDHFFFANYIGGILSNDNLDLPIILRIRHILVMNGSEADCDLEYGPPVHGPPLWT